MVIIRNSDFEFLKKMEKVTLTDEQEKVEKYKIIDRIKEKIDIRWNRSKKLLQVIDTYIYFGLDRGFTFYGRETMAKWCDASLSTVDKAIRILKESKEVIVAYRHNPDSNGYKTPVMILVEHRNFAKISSFLNLKKEVENKVEKRSTPTGTSAPEEKKASTYYLPSKKHLIHMSLDKSYIPDIVDNKFAEEAWPFYQDVFQILKLWRTVQVAGKQFGFDKHRLYELSDEIVSAFKQTVTASKKPNYLKKGFENYFYGVLYNKFMINQTQMDIYRLQGKIPS